MTDSRAAIKADLEVLREINIEAKLVRLRLAQLRARKRLMSLASIAQAHGAALREVQSIAHSMGWTDAEKSLAEPLPPYEAYHLR